MNEVIETGSGEANKGEMAPGGVSGGDNLRDRIEDTLRTVFDPEIPVNIFDLGLVYEIRINEGGKKPSWSWVFFNCQFYTSDNDCVDSP
jgi:hypothetical protein